MVTNKNVNGISFVIITNKWITTCETRIYKTLWGPGPANFVYISGNESFVGEDAEECHKKAVAWVENNAHFFSDKPPDSK